MSWKLYQQKDNYGCNMLEYFKVFKEAGRNTPLYQRGMVREPDGKFEDDARHDRLPAVSWIIPTSVHCEHPDFIPAAGAAFVASKLDAIAANPAVWAKTAVIINYDENDGLFDHVPPPVPPGDARRVRETRADRRRDFACRASSFRLGRPAAGCAASRWTTRRCCGSWRNGPASPSRTFPLARETFGDITSAFRFNAPAAAPRRNCPRRSRRWPA